MLLLYLSLLDDGDQLLLRRLYNEYKNCMYYAAYDILHDEGLAEDAVHTAFVNVSGHLHKLSNIKSVGTKWYLLTAVQNSAKKIYNNRKTTIGFCEAEENVYRLCGESDPETELSGKLSKQRFVKALNEMKPKYRDILIMKYYREAKDREIANVLGLSESAVRKRLERARKELIKIYGGDNGEE